MGEKGNSVPTGATTSGIGGLHGTPQPQSGAGLHAATGHAGAAAAAPGGGGGLIDPVDLGVDKGADAAIDGVKDLFHHGEGPTQA